MGAREVVTYICKCCLGQDDYAERVRSGPTTFRDELAEVLGFPPK